MAEPAEKRILGTGRSAAGFDACVPHEGASEQAAAMSRRRFLELGVGAVAGVALLGAAGCGSARRIARGPRERTGGEGEDRERRRGGRGFGLGRLLRRLF